MRNSFFFLYTHTILPWPASWRESFPGILVRQIDFSGISINQDR